MFANERLATIIDRVNAKQSVTVSELTQLFGVSFETIRRDLAYLEKQNLLQRVHGGAVSMEKMRRFSTLPQRMEEHRELKRELSLTALSLITENDVIAVDSGSTAVEFAAVLRDNRQRLTVVTPSPDVFEILCRKEEFRIIMIGGQYLSKERTFYGPMAVDAIEGLHVSKSIIFPSSVSLRQGVGTNIFELIPVQRAMMAISDQVVVAADSTKFEAVSQIRLCGLDAGHFYVTDRQLAADRIRLFEERGITVMTQSPPG